VRRAARTGTRTPTPAAARAPLAALLALAAMLLAPPAAHGQAGGGDGPDITLGGLLRTGLLTEPGSLDRTDGFRIHDARLRASGEIGIVFDYRVQAEWDTGADRFRLLDAELSLPITSELALELGQLKAPFGREMLQGKGEITFVERAQATHLLAPGRQVGARLSGRALDDRLSYSGGLFNGNGRRLENDNDAFLWAARASYNTVGAAEFYDELVVEVGADVGYSRDDGVDLAARLDRPVGGALVDLADFSGDRLLLGADARAGWRGFFLRGEYLRAELEPEGGVVVGDLILDDEVVLEGGYLEGGYSFLGAIEGTLRWDRLDAGLTSVDGFRIHPSGPPAPSDFLVVGINLFPGYHTRIGLQYAAGLGGTEVGPGLADGQFGLTAQVDF
jgi:hypothetical protein